MGAKECRIPVKVIRDVCSWFGVLVQGEDNQFLFARKEPGDQKSTDEMMFIFGKQIEIPSFPKTNSNRERICRILDEYAKITFQSLGDDEINGFDSRPSFRDMMAFSFQPQNIVANANTLFYKADTMEHRTKLINIFPYILGAINGDILAKRRRLDFLKKELKRKERELEKIKIVSEKWDIEIRNWLKTAQSLGLMDKKVEVEKLTYKTCVSFLSEIAKCSANNAKVTNEGLEIAIKELNNLIKQEKETSYELNVNIMRKREMLLFCDNIERYRKNLSIQRERLDISSWISELVDQNGLCPFCGADHRDDLQVKRLVENLRRIEEESVSVSEIPAAFEREFDVVSGQIQKLTERLHAIQESIKIIQNKAESVQEQKYTMESIARFIGKVEYAQDIYNSINQDGQLDEDIRTILEEIKILQNEVDETAIRKRIMTALEKLQYMIMYQLPMLDLEDSSAPVKFDYHNLTIKVLNDQGREDYLWQMGSGSNWLAYHVAVSLAFQRFATEQKNSPIAQFVIYDQPSQVYFPQKLAERNIQNDDPKLADEDIVAVRKLFETFSKSIADTNKKIQIIVLEHADEGVWEGLENVHKVCEWRGNDDKLIPLDWINSR